MTSLSMYQYLSNISESTDHWSSMAKCTTTLHIRSVLYLKNRITLEKL